MFDVQEKPISSCQDPVPLLLAPPRARPAAVTLKTMIDAYLQEYEVGQFRVNIARRRVAHLRAHFGQTSAAGTITTYGIREYQVARRQQGPLRPRSIGRRRP